MADKAISELVETRSVTPDSLFVLQQDGTAKKLTAQVLENWLVSFADGHGGIQSIVKKSTSGLVDTYRITLADTTTFDFMVTNGKGINSVSKVSTSGLVDTYRIAFNDGTSSTFTVTNGEKGDKGDRADIWVKYASQKPTASSHSFGDVPDSWIGIATGHNMDTAPTDWQQYTWFQWKGEKGDTGDPATLISAEIRYQVGDSGTIMPSGSWSESVPPVTPGKFLWTRQVLQFNTGAPIISYSISRFGIDGTGSVSTVAGISPDAAGNVPLTAANVNALPIGGGTMGGSINMNGQSLYGLNTPTKNDEAATKGYVDELKNDTETYVNNAVRTAAPRNLLDNSYFERYINQRGISLGQTKETGYKIDRWIFQYTGNAGEAFFGLGNDYASIKAPSDGYADLVQNINTIEIKKGATVTFAAHIIYGDTEETVCATLKFRTSPAATYLVDDKLAVYSTDVGNIIIRSIWSGGEIQFKWAALYEGEYTAETLPVYQPKGYGVELAECQRYYQVIDISGLPGMFISGTKFITKCPNTVPMRVFPTLIELLKDNIVTHDPSGSQLILPVKQYILEKGTNGYKIAIESEGAYLYFPGMIFSGKIALSAGL